MSKHFTLPPEVSVPSDPDALLYQIWQETDDPRIATYFKAKGGYGEETFVPERTELARTINTIVRCRRVKAAIEPVNKELTDQIRQYWQDNPGRILASKKYLLTIKPVQVKKTIIEARTDYRVNWAER